jgi:predicted nucleic acid-binding protein
MVLVDTSVWIRFLAGREPYATGLDGLLSRDEVVGHDMVFGELLIGDRGGRAKLLGAYANMHHSATVPHDEVVEFVRQRRLFGRGVGWIDLHLLASAVVGRLKLWTADQEFAAVAAELRIAFKDESA